jgi:hypothetical protein
VGGPWSFFVTLYSNGVSFHLFTSLQHPRPNFGGATSQCNSVQHRPAMSSSVRRVPSPDDEEELHIIPDDDGNALQQANDPFGDPDDGRGGGIGSTDPYGGSEHHAGSVSHVSEGHARVVIPSAHVDADEDENCCGVCLDEPEEGSRAKLLCCRNKLCLGCAQRIGACPFCRAEPLMWGLR